MIQLTVDEYDALVVLAKRSAQTEEEKRSLANFIAAIDKKNSIERDTIQVRWLDSNQPLPPTASFPFTWPPYLSGSVVVTGRKIAKADVSKYVQSKTSAASNIMVTRDPAGKVGWAKLEDYFAAG